jgi:hypothetical protein
MYYEQQNTLDGVGELMKHLWLILDNPKIEVKDRMKAMNLKLHCYNMWFRLKALEYLSEFSDYTDKGKTDDAANIIREQEISRREKASERALEDYLKNEKLTRSEIN